MSSVFTTSSKSSASSETNKTKPINARIGSPIGLLLALTYAIGSGATWMDLTSSSQATFTKTNRS